MCDQCSKDAVVGELIRLAQIFREDSGKAMQAIAPILLERARGIVHGDLIKSATEDEWAFLHNRKEPYIVE